MSCNLLSGDTSKIYECSYENKIATDNEADRSADSSGVQENRIV